MNVQESLDKVKNSTEYQKWVAEQKDVKLVHIFILVDPKEETGYDVGFFNYDNKKMTSFSVAVDGKIEMQENQDVFKEDEKTNVLSLDETKIKISFDEAMKIADELQKEKYSTHKALKKVVILQHIEQGQIWNVTFVTQQFCTLNIKIDSETGEVVEDKLHKLFTMDSDEKSE